MIKYYSAEDLLNADKSQLSYLPSWVMRVHDDVWPCAIQLKNGTNIEFDVLRGIEFGNGREETWLHIADEDNYIIESGNTCLEIEGADRGIKVRLSEVVAFWERADT